MNRRGEPCTPYAVIPAQAGTQIFQSVAPCSGPGGQALGPAFAGATTWGPTVFLNRLEGRDLFPSGHRPPVPCQGAAFAGVTKYWVPSIRSDPLRCHAFEIAPRRLGEAECHRRVGRSL